MTFKRPISSGKVSGTMLTDMHRSVWTDNSYISNDPTLYTYETDGRRFDFLLRPKEVGSDRLFVLFSGDAMRKQNAPPVFQRWSWANFFPGHCLYISDPALYVDERIGLAWYSGDRNVDYLEVIASLVRRISEKLGVQENNVYAYGSSGGGFASLRFLHFMSDAKAIVINPQTSVVKYEKKSVERYLSICLGCKSREVALEKFLDRIDLTQFPDRLIGRKIAYIQNEQDVHHVLEHYGPLMGCLGLEPHHAPNHLIVPRFHYSHEGGHKAAETPEVFNQVMQKITSGLF